MKARVRMRSVRQLSRPLRGGAGWAPFEGAAGLSVFGPSAFALSVFGLALWAPQARAEIQLLEPAPRYRFEQRSCPCGVGGSAGTCDLERDGSDPARSMRVSRFELGQTITIRLNETRDQSGRFRVAFDPDGADMDDFNANILLDVEDPIDFGPGQRELSVQLPSTPCSNCTLQVVQVASGVIDRPVPDPSGFFSYYACADLELVVPGTLPAGEEEPGAGGGGGAGGGDSPMAGGSAMPGAGASGVVVQGAPPGGAAGQAGGGLAEAVESAAGDRAPGGAGAEGDEAEGDEAEGDDAGGSGGCSLRGRALEAPGTPGSWLVAALALVWHRRRRC